MRYFLMLLLAMTVGLNTACSHKKSSSTATPPKTEDTDTDNDTDVDTDDCDSNCYVVTIPGVSKPANNKWYYGPVLNIQKTAYKKFIKAGFGVYADGGAFGDGGNYSWNYQCDFNIFAMIFDGQGFNCGTQQSQFDQYVTQMSNLPAIITLSFFNDGHVEGNWLVDAYDMGYQGINYYMGIPFQGNLLKLSNGKYLIEAGPLTLVVAKVQNGRATYNAYFFDGYSDLPLGTVTVK